MKIPKEVKEAAKWLIANEHGKIVPLGKYKGQDAFMFRFDEEMETGFPFVYLHKEGEVSEVTGFDALRVVGSLVKD